MLNKVTLTLEETTEYEETHVDAGNNYIDYVERDNISLSEVEKFLKQYDIDANPKAFIDYAFDMQLIEAFDGHMFGVRTKEPLFVLAAFIVESDISFTLIYLWIQYVWNYA